MNIKKYFLYWLFIPIFTLIIGFIIGYIDFAIISPNLPFPDPCKYHMPNSENPPFWMEFLYMDSSTSHVDSSPNSNHLSIFALICISLGFIVSRKIINNFF